MKGEWLPLTCLGFKEHVFVEFRERFQLDWNKGLLICIFLLLTVFGLVHDKKCFH